MNISEAEELARRHLSPIFSPIEIVILPQYTVEKSYGWLFDYESKDYLEGKARHPLLHGLLLVERSGKIVPFPTYLPRQEAIRLYEAGQPLTHPYKRRNA
jgi:hypothetical protein